MRWSAPTPIGVANGESEVNRVALANPLAEGPSPANAPAFTFGEASINLTGLGIIPEGECAPFSSAYVKSRASDAFNSAVKDFIAPQSIDLDNCGEIIIEKVTDPASDTTTEFGFTLTGPDTDEAFNLVGGGSNSTPGLFAGTYVATEATIPRVGISTRPPAMTAANLTPSIWGSGRRSPARSPTWHGPACTSSRRLSVTAWTFDFTRLVDADACGLLADRQQWRGTGLHRTSSPAPTASPRRCPRAGIWSRSDVRQR